MIRLALRQFRTQLLVACAGLAVASVVMAITGPNLASLYDTAVAACKPPADCSLAASRFVENDALLQAVLGSLLLVVPALIGLFWGAPLIARELESGTFRLVLTQSVSRNRWFIVKLAVTGLAALTAAGLLSWIITWWFTPLDKVTMNQFAPGVFDERNIVAIGYAAFALGLGVTAGTLLRRTLPAMALALLGFIAARVAMAILVRPRLIAPVDTIMSISSSSGLGFAPSPAGVTFVANPPTIPNALVISSQVVDYAGHPTSDASLHQFLSNACPNIVSPPPPPSGITRAPANQGVFQDCITQLSAHFHLAVTSQPASRYWTFQWYETAIFISFALILVGLCLWFVRRRLA